MTRQETITKTVIVKMLKEDTGSSLCDSGMIYGYAYERRRAIKNFDDLPRDWKCDCGEDNCEGYIMNTYKIFIEHLAYDSKMTRRLIALCNRKKNANRDYAECINEFIESVEDEDGIRDGFNTACNDESKLDTDCVYAIFEHGEQAYAVLRIHGGCDLRGGYTDPKVFRIKTDMSSFMDDMEL